MYVNVTRSALIDDTEIVEYGSNIYECGHRSHYLDDYDDDLRYAVNCDFHQKPLIKIKKLTFKIKIEILRVDDHNLVSVPKNQWAKYGIL